LPRVTAQPPVSFRPANEAAPHETTGSDPATARGAPLPVSTANSGDARPVIGARARPIDHQRYPEALPDAPGPIAPAPPGRATPTLRVPDAALMFRTLTAWNEAISPRDAQRIDELTQQSNAGRFASLQPFIEDGDPAINRSLRTHRHWTHTTQRFLSDFAQLRDYRGESYRAAWLKPAALDALLHRAHTRFFDDGIQIASVALPHAQIWLRHLREAQRNLKPAILIFDASVRQKNLSHGNGQGMVAVEPGVSLELRRVTQHWGITFALFCAADEADGLLTKLPNGSLVRRSTV
jgi:hypothetical protein